MQAALDEALAAWDEANPEPSRESAEFEQWEDNQRNEFDRIGVQFSQDSDWYDSNLVWIDVD